MIIKSLQRTTLLDYPGKIAAIFFVGGCNFRCPFCQNPELVVGFESLPTIGEEEALDFLKSRLGFLEGVVLSGGEPTLYEDLPDFIKQIKDLPFLVKLDTNGTNPEMLKDLLKRKLIDYVAMDFKGPRGKYKDITKTKDKVFLIRRTIKLLLQSGIDFELRTTVVPNLHSKEDLIEMAKELCYYKPPAISDKLKWYLQQFRPTKCLDPELEKVKPYPKEFFEEILPEIKKYIPQTQLRGIK
jgi:pyruvate formate lyase activating enzyme